MFLKGSGSMAFSIRPTHRAIPTTYLLLLAAARVVLGADPNLQLIVSNETIPAGATGQIKVWAASPTPMAYGGFNIYFDPNVFSAIVGFGSFSANGDVTAKATAVGTALGATFSSATASALGAPPAGIGRLPDLPVFTMNVTVNPGVAAGTKSTFTLDVTPTPWIDANWQHLFGNRRPG
jgi:hypothetical protein